MTREEAISAAAVRAFVKIRPKDGSQHCTHFHQIVGVHNESATLRKGSACREVDLSELILDTTKNTEHGIRVEVASANGNGKHTHESEPHVVFNSIEWLGWSGEKWTDNDDQWLKYEDHSRAKEAKSRFATNGMKGIEVLRFSEAVDRLYRHIEEGVSSGATETPANVPDAFLSGLGDLATASVLREFAKVAEEDKIDARDNVSDQDLKSKLNVQMMDLARQIAVIDNRVNLRTQRRAARQAELVGLKAKLLAMLKL
jgi:hypothetical protein